MIAAIAARQHGVITFEQLLKAGLSQSGISRRVKAGRLHRIHKGVYAVGHRGLSREGWWMAAVLACGQGAVLSHSSAAALWGMRDRRDGPDPRDRAQLQWQGTPQRLAHPPLSAPTQPNHVSQPHPGHAARPHALRPAPDRPCSRLPPGPAQGRVPGPPDREAPTRRHSLRARGTVSCALPPASPAGARGERPRSVHSSLTAFGASRGSRWNSTASGHMAVVRHSSETALVTPS